MPGYKVHLLGGIAAYIVAYMIVFCAVQMMHPSLEIAAGWFLATCAGALFPDIDIKSKGQKYFYWLILVLLCISIWRFKQHHSSERFNIVACIAILAVIPMLVRHRGITHKTWFILLFATSLWIAVAMFWPCYCRISFFYALFFAVGGISHIYLDRSRFFRSYR